VKGKTFKEIASTLALLFLSSCATTGISSIANPKFAEKSFKKIVIAAPFSDISLRKQTEQEFTCQFIMTSALAIPSLDVIPPFKDYSEPEILEILRKNRIDAVFVVALTDFWMSKTYIPKSSSTSGTVSAFGGSLHYQSYAQEHGGYYVNKPRLEFDVRLFDVESGEAVWMATSLTKGNAFAHYKTLCISLAGRVVDKLIEDNIIGKIESRP